MNSLKVTSIVLILIGSTLFGIGLIIYWFTTGTESRAPVATTVSPWASVLVLIGLLIMLAAIIYLCLGIHYELEASIEDISRTNVANINAANATAIAKANAAANAAKAAAIANTTTTNPTLNIITTVPR